MASFSGKQGGDQAMGFLNDLQDWELSLKKPQSGKQVSTSGKASNTGEYDYLRNYNSVSHMSSYMDEENSPDAASEKELGNEYFKQKKFKEAIDCYSRSIALSPTAVTYANRAMAYLKIKKEAEEDCTEALNLDDRYIKAYSRRATARKELGKLKAAIEDSEFALRLEPHNQEIKKQHAEVKSLYEKEVIQKASEAKVTSKKGLQEVVKPKIEVNGSVQDNSSVTSGSLTTRLTSIQDQNKKNHKTSKLELKESVQELASRAALHATVEAARNIKAPQSAYQFEVSWQGLSGDRALQASLLKTMSPDALPRIFKNALSAPILMDIIKCIATFFNEELDFAVSFLDNLTKVPRFEMIIMCLSSADRTDLSRLWEQEFCKNAIPMEYVEMKRMKLQINSSLLKDP
ncbi:RNA-polymerase II-associated protein 3-like, C-terminal domain [Dillenia turbinata]|uniref:RNA-polymerase II-associated protein 3-like, C-terminal domain n=1 Tax=Dillenia turbinata TaxID=194707 RepID=A0AAN8YQQ0_9MAGN